jgi:hypothetical protein
MLPWFSKDVCTSKAPHLQKEELGKLTLLKATCF